MKAAPEVVAPINDGMRCPYDESWCRQPECRPTWCLTEQFLFWKDHDESDR